MSRRFILDSSLALSWCIADEKTELSHGILDGLIDGDSALVPSLWVWEINNALWQAERYGRLEAITRSQQIIFLQKLPIDIEESAYRHVWGDTANIARECNLSIYDASYLELALRHGLALGSLDKALRRAAHRKKVSCLPAN